MLKLVEVDALMPLMPLVLLVLLRIMLPLLMLAADLAKTDEVRARRKCMWQREAGWLQDVERCTLAFEKSGREARWMKKEE